MDSIKHILHELTEKAPGQTLAWAYFEGDHPLVFSTDKLREALKISSSVRSPFTENWIAVIVDSVTERLRMTGFSLGDGSKQDARATALNALYDADLWATLADDIHQSVEVTGEAFVIVQKTDTGVEAYLQNSACCVALYDEIRPKQLKVVAKTYHEGETAFMVIYTATEVTVWHAPVKSATDPAAYVLAESTPGAPNPAAVDGLPVFHFTANRKIAPTFKSAIPLQDAVNKQFSDLMVTSDFMAFPFRYFVTNAKLPDKMPMAPGDYLTLPAGDGRSEDTQVGQLAAGSLENYTNSMDRTASVMASITRTPKHYFTKQGGDPSGEALQAMEAPLIAKVRRRMERARPTWANLAAYCLGLLGQSCKPEEVTVNYDDPRTIQSLSEAQTRSINVTAGLPLVTQLRDAGWRQDELDQMLEDRQTERGPVDKLPEDHAAAVQITEESLAPLIERVTTVIGDVALQKLLDGGRMEQLAKAAADAKAASA